MKQRLLFVLLFILLSIGSGYLITTISSGIVSGIKNNFTHEDSEKNPTSESYTRYTLLDEVPERGSGKWESEFDELLNFEFDSGTSKRTIITYSTLAFLFTTIIIIVIIRRSKKRAQNKEIVDDEKITKVSVNKQIEYNNNPEIIRTSNYHDLHKIRRILIEWEKNLSNSTKKKPQETISEWFKRIGGPTDIIDIYEKVRYGDKVISNEEISKFKRILNK
ncbi:hypothetical protein B0G93_11558 [Bacillus sp. V-88]|uniref:DUF4129 domain-containing protein n=1 Tax=Rossellomorea vietnamensis TaxID=218284 RepID=A0A6I6UMS2_9BACI|nr:hypothetical protein [Rossellomorea vietnamensis]OXS58170.1 hypothetical protein B1B00_14575 [Bacillus sp. DSM 27956]PRX75276.1 hypothetical protein B0G93_11558 [Bacillus sp. V-88]QHE62637.1 hypothetical protein FHE72_17600 [Rossellomorea vietnamensis]SLK23727.1 hypothetical protein SAMN06295884_11558 [Bacillus sp. V-88]